MSDVWARVRRIERRRIERIHGTYKNRDTRRKEAAHRKSIERAKKIINGYY